MCTCVEQQMLQHFRHLAEAILRKHIAVFNHAVQHEASEQQCKGLNTYLQSINTELKANADRLLNEVKTNRQVDCKKLQEHLFVLRKDYFNDFIKRSEINNISVK